jgi:hypothetical protein
MPLAEDQHPIEEFAAQSASEAFADRVHARRLDGVRRILASAAWKTASKERVKFDPRSRSRNLMSSNRSPRLVARLRAC